MALLVVAIRQETLEPAATRLPVGPTGAVTAAESPADVVFRPGFGAGFVQSAAAATEGFVEVVGSGAVAGPIAAVGSEESDLPAVLAEPAPVETNPVAAGSAATAGTAGNTAAAAAATAGNTAEKAAAAIAAGCTVSCATAAAVGPAGASSAECSAAGAAGTAGSSARRCRTHSGTAGTAAGSGTASAGAGGRCSAAAAAMSAGTAANIAADTSSPKSHANLMTTRLLGLGFSSLVLAGRSSFLGAGSANWMCSKSRWLAVLINSATLALASELISPNSTEGRSFCERSALVIKPEVDFSELVSDLAASWSFSTDFGAAAGLFSSLGFSCFLGAASSSAGLSKALKSSPGSAKSAIGLPTGISLVPSCTRISHITPSSCASTSMVALSVSTSNKTSPAEKDSPDLTFHDTTPPSVIVGDMAGMLNTEAARTRAVVWKKAVRAAKPAAVALIDLYM